MQEKNFICTPHAVMGQEEFLMNLEGQLQYRALYDETELQEIARLRRNMELVNHKSNVRQAEFAAKQAMRNKGNKIFWRNNEAVLQVINGMNIVVGEWQLFLCRVEAVKRYTRTRSKQNLWQVELVEHVGGLKVKSQLYDEEFLQSPSRLKKTILGRYFGLVSSNIKSLAWEWMYSIVLAMYERADILELPLKAGWHEGEHGWLFWTSDSSETELLNEQILRFSVEKFHEINVEDVLKNLLSDAEKVSSRECVSAMLILRWVALLGRLITNETFRVGITIVGENAEMVARTFLTTMYSSYDIVNLDSDRLGLMRERAKLLQDTPIIFISSDMDCKSTKNRLKEVMSWMNTGNIEGEKVMVPYIFCIRNFSKEYPLDDMFLINADKISLFIGDVGFSKLQNFIISTIENSGSYWVEELRKKYKSIRKINYKCNLFLLVDSIVSIVMKMLADEIEEKNYLDLQDFLQLGAEEIRCQFTQNFDVLTEVFRESVINLVERGEISAVEKGGILLEGNIICYDTDCYYFTDEVLKFICQKAKISEKSLLFIKQKIVEQGFVKLYKTSCNHGRELEVDFFMYNPEGQRRRMSGFAINREFWDEIGGIALYERGNA